VRSILAAASSSAGSTTTLCSTSCKPINEAVPIANYASIPNPWPDVFYLVWVLDLTGSSYVWTSLNQNLMSGDV
jgi:hypothetical protein